ncbi:SiaB family protein kinase [Desulfovibrio mangrovi]|uniref:SiaB family protein kinase n=1 Tax=Desulfovibrio mangrovi TaxID=2976983 RepID=UPI00224587A9|nr:SiaB family protein kinase [Desulfovibrio mangrovi]UZP66420.1 SiaB family protein kinase [Desulfovibrio mangrovi]
MDVNMLSYHETMSREGVVLYYNGPISQGVVEGVGDMMRRKMVLEENGMLLAQKVFSVLVEQMQNVICYARDICTPTACMGTGQIMVGRSGEQFYVACGNPVSRKREDRIRERIDTVNGMTREELKAYYKEQRRKGPDEDSCGAGLGFIEMARKASRPLQYRFDPIDDDTSFFAVKVHV